MHTTAENSRHWRLTTTLATALFTFAACNVMAGDTAVTLSGDHEVPAVTTAATGHGTLTVKDDRSIRGSIKTTDLTSTIAHIHHAAAGVNGAVIITLDRKSDDEWVVPDGAKLTEAQYRAYQSGELYVNVHSAAHPGGEIRAQIAP